MLSFVSTFRSIRLSTRSIIYRMQFHSLAFTLLSTRGVKQWPPKLMRIRDKVVYTFAIIPHTE